ncbi:P-loop containing nucleoside triphosphate hydrolase protein [Thozetella sp. PMI_491]|nr:P-loop containing nucleoside triphosphate hydrolase protein [Thozetella sp. PMI_491]
MVAAAAVRAYRCRHGQRHLLFSLCQRSRGHQTQARSYQDSKLDNIRNIGIIAHVDAGKTTTTERMLYHSGVTRHIGSVDHGSTVTDFLPLEREKGITIQSAAITFPWPAKDSLRDGEEPKTINLIDTPGHQDFRYEVDRCLPELDGAVCILDSVQGVETHTERVWSSALENRIPALIYVNKFDCEGASFKRSVQDIASRLRVMPLICQIPWWDKDNFIGVIDLVNRIGMRFTSTGVMSRFNEKKMANDNPALWDSVEKARASLIEVLAENDDQMLEDFTMYDGVPPVPSIKGAIRRLLLGGNGKFAPIFVGASKPNTGVQPLMDAIIDYLPTPAERPGLEVTIGPETYTLQSLLEKDKSKKGYSPHRPPVTALAHVFKVSNDDRRGMMSFVRVYYGTLNRGHQTWNTTINAAERPLGMLHIAGQATHDIQHLSTGHIGALTGLKSARTGDTLLAFSTHGAPEQWTNVQIRPVKMPPAVAFIAMEAFGATAAKSLHDALSKMTREDPSLRWEQEAKNELYFTLRGMGYLHLEVARDRLRNHYRIDDKTALFHEIEVEYKECLISPVGPHRAEYSRTLLDKAGKAACSVEIAPIEEYNRDELAASGVEREGNIITVNLAVSDEADLRALPFDAEVVQQQLVNGVAAALARGPRRGSPLGNCHVTIVFDPKTDYFPSSTGGHIMNAATQAARTALKEAHQGEKIGVLEPVMDVYITCPESAADAIQHDLTSSRGGRVLEVRQLSDGVSNEGSVDISGLYIPPDPYEADASLRDSKKAGSRTVEIVGVAPLKEMLRYDAQLRGWTTGRHSIHMDPSGYERVTGPREKAVDSMLQF